jgi:hypothetical protein
MASHLDVDARAADPRLEDAAVDEPFLLRAGLSCALLTVVGLATHHVHALQVGLGGTLACLLYAAVVWYRG